MSKAAKKRRMRGDEDCPYCGNDDACQMDWGEMEAVGECDWQFQQIVKCDECGRRWMDCFTMSDVRELC
jgi:hypothetical protein